MAATSLPREKFEGKFRYPGKVVSAGKPVIETTFVDWFENDEAALAGFREIMEGQGYKVIEVRIGEVTEVEIA